MKKLLVFLAVTISPLSICQIKDVSHLQDKCETVGKVAPMGSFMGEVEKCSDNLIKFSYRDLKFSSIINIKRFSFEDKDGALDYLYITLIKGLDELPEEDKVLQLPNDLLLIKFKKTFGVPVATIYHTNNASVLGVTQSFTKKQIDKLFGKEKK
ncbi:hypothetical protein BA768_01220 [Chryseobacterium sp. CBo1]|uniref:hypothetical protein n=1 Tax=Chryseobacterium sp. CBo1 TaxID=1869230 RepID=UPI0008108813|nr:hypothetical protein [Chryseobacterium sp. CBo1]OCK53205.1 hypothetical protein BA768_01220 [Chryseobacterium sp. CBo1]